MHWFQNYESQDSILNVKQSSKKKAFDTKSLEKKFQRLMKSWVDSGNDSEASRQLKKLQNEIPNFSPLYDDITLTLEAIENSSPVNPAFHAAALHVSGTKREVYAKGYGLVYLEAQKKDGQKVTLKLVEGTPNNGKSYMLNPTGKWIYEVQIGNEKPVKMELNRSLSPTGVGFQISETKIGSPKKKDNAPAQPSFNFAKKPRRKVKKDFPIDQLIQMRGVLDHICWGFGDLGYGLQFSCGEAETKVRAVPVGPQLVNLKAARRVTASLEDFEFTDSKKNSHTFEDAMEVQLDVDFSGLSQARSAAALYGLDVAALSAGQEEALPA